MYGGFAGNETALGQRDPATNPTILSGDLNGDDIPFITINTPNSATVVSVIDALLPVRLDGFEVEAGHTGASAAIAAGLTVVNSNAQVVDCRFLRHVGNWGGGVAAVSLSTLSLENCTLDSNIASRGSPGGGDGGGIYASQSTVTLTDCAVVGNSARDSTSGPNGGGAYVGGASTITATRCSFRLNDALSNGQNQGIGGAVGIDLAATFYAFDCTFEGNTANAGGAIGSPFGVATATTVNCTFEGNRAVQNALGGGAGGAVFLSTLTMIGCTVYGGTADNVGGVNVGAGRISGSIFWGNSDNKGTIGDSQVNAAFDVEYSCVQNMLVGLFGEDPPDPAQFPGSIDSDPLFVDPILGNLRLQPGSPCIDAADNLAWTGTGVTTDLDGNLRFVDDPATPDTGSGVAPVVDMGAYELRWFRARRWSVSPEFRPQGSHPCRFSSPTSLPECHRRHGPGTSETEPPRLFSIPTIPTRHRASTPCRSRPRTPTDPVRCHSRTT